jgi:hypothetical protein
MTDAAVLDWRKSMKYLPRFLRDFHDQKDTFKALHEVVNVEGHDYCKDVNWVAGQCYIIDIFLWHMARHGYVLRRAATKLPFDDIHETNARAKQSRDAMSAKMLGMTLSDRSPSQDSEAGNG